MRKIAILVAALSLSIPAAALAEPVAKGQAWKVGANSYHLYLTDLDLRSAAGRAQALARVEKIAGKLCAKGTRAQRDRCVADTIATSTTGSAQDALRLALTERGSTWLAAAPSN